MVILENKSLPSNIKKKTLPSSTIKTIYLPLEGTHICVPLLYGHIFFHMPRSRPIFRSISLVDAIKNPLLGFQKFYIKLDLKK